ncbi:uncharacterized protein si:dkey-154b15.1 isoform X2 [Hypomesus transpacificus]|uniref:uncharacterized protein si:dkey-154b15.1 isoform X2 n=1 Tax=Hypomesus transpacificus TaxID=137520 RepID=UPI001F08130B|nr:uncharacterized protein si:dkey-154b15.1 isoform X2 [Hypomesus transpacificus]
MYLYLIDQFLWNKLNAVVNRVLKRSHVLEFDKHAFTLQVKAADRPEVDLPAEASLNMRLFSSERTVLRLLMAHGLRVTEKLQGELRVQGSFLRLREVKAQLQLLDAQPPTPYPSINGHEQSLGAFAKSTNRGRDVSCSPVFNSPAAVNGDCSALSPSLPSSPSSEFLYGQPSPPGDGARSSSRDTPSTWPPASFMADPDLLRFARSFKQKDIDLILKNHKVRMDVKGTEGADVSSVALQGRDVQAAMEKLQGLLNTLAPTIRTQQIQLQSLDHNVQVEVGKRIQIYKDDFPSVMIRQVGDTLRLVGPSRDSYELKRRILGEPVDLPPAPLRGRPQSREPSSRRSSSLPRQLHKRDSSSSALERDPFPDLAAPDQGSSRDQGGSRSAGFAGGVLEAGAGPAANRRGRQRSSSESREKKKEQKEMMQQANAEPAPSSGPISPRRKMTSLLQKFPTSKEDVMKVFRKRNSPKKP